MCKQIIILEKNYITNLDNKYHKGRLKYCQNCGKFLIPVFIKTFFQYISWFLNSQDTHKQIMHSTNTCYNSLIIRYNKQKLYITNMTE